MITQVRPLAGATGIRAAAAKARPQVNPLVRNQGAISLILEQVREQLEEAVTKGRFGRTVLDVRFDPNGVYDFDLLSGPQRNVV